MWDTATGYEKPSLKGLSQIVPALKVSPDGKTLASLGMVYHKAEKNRDIRFRKGVIKLWDLATGAHRVLHRETSGCLCLAWSPDSQLLAIGASSGGQARVFDLRGKSPPTTPALLGNGWIDSLAFSPDGKTLAVGRADHFVHLCEVVLRGNGASPRVTARSMLRGHLDEPMQLSFSPDGTVLASADRGAVRLWDLATGTERTVIRKATRAVFLADNRLAIRRGGAVVRWEIPSAKQGITLAQRQVFAVALSPDGKTLATGGGDAGNLAGVRAASKSGRRLRSGENGIRLWDLATGKSSTLPTDCPVDSLAYSSDGRWLAGGQSAPPGAVSLWPGSGGKLPTHRKAWNGFGAISFSRDGRTLFGGNNIVSAWQVSDEGRLTPQEPPPFPIIPAKRVFDIGGGLLLHGAFDRLYRVDYSALTTKELPFGNATRVAVSADRRRVVAVGSGQRAAIFDVADGKNVVAMETNGVRITALAFSPDGKSVAGGGRDRVVRVWDAATGQLRALLEGHTCEITAVAFAPDGKMLASASAYPGTSWWIKGGEIKLWYAGDPPQALRDQYRDAEDADALHIRGRNLAARGDWAGAIASYTRAIDGGGDRRILEERGAIHSRMGRFAEAAADYGRTHNAWNHACNLLLAGDEAGYRKVCAALLARHEKDSSHGSLFSAARACTLGEGAVDAPRRVLDMAKRAVDASPTTSWYRRTLATAHLRAGDFDEAIALHSKLLGDKASASATLHWLPLAIAHHKKGQPDEARKWYDKADKILDAAVKAMPADAATPDGMHVNDWLEAQCLRRDAAKILGIRK